MPTTTTDADALRTNNLALARTWMTTLNEPAWWNLIDDDIVLEFPYAPSLGMPDRVVGKTDVVAYIHALFARLGVMRFDNLVVNGTSDPNVVFNEYTADLKTPNGEHYTQIYVNKLRFKDGKVVLMREFWDPKRIVDAANGNFSFAS